MTTGIYTDLINHISRCRERIASYSGSTSIPYVDETFKAFNESYVEILDTFIEILKEGLGTIQPDILKIDIFETLQYVDRHHKEVTEFEHLNLFFWLKELKEDFNINIPIAFITRSQFAIRGVSDCFPQLAAFDAFTKVEKHEENIEEIKESNCKIIEFPTTEIGNPLSYSLIVHECFHYAKEFEKLKEILDKKFNDWVADSEKAEIIIDFLSLFYMGPVYCLMISRMPTLMGIHSGYDHPDQDTRLFYMLEYLQYIKKNYQKKVGQKLKFIDKIHQKIEREINSCYKELKGDKKEKSPFKTEFEDVISTIRDFFEEREITYYENELRFLCRYFNVRNKYLPTMLSKLQELLNAKKGLEAFLPVKPLLLLNFLVIAEDYEKRREVLNEMLLVSFKKWRIRRAFCTYPKFSPSQVNY